MNVAAIVENIGKGKIVTDIYSGKVKCKCGKRIKFDELSLGGFGNSLSCSCGYRFWMAEEKTDELLVYEGYDYTIEESFVMIKQRVYSRVNWIKHRIEVKSLTEHNEYLYIDFENNILVYFDDNGKVIKDEGKSFFRNISIEDMKVFSEQVELYCNRNKIAPNYGMILKKLNSLYSTYEYELILKKILGEYYIESFIKEGLGYLFEYNFLGSLKILEKNLCIDKTATTCSKVLGIPKKVVSYIRENRLKVDEISSLQSFFRENNYNDFKILISDRNSVFQICDLRNLNFLLRRGYSSYKLNKYATETINIEQLEKKEFLMYLVDSVRMSKTANFQFRLYSRRLKERHDELAAKYKLVENQVINRKLFEVSRGIEIKQYGDKYITIVPKSVRDFKKEGQNQKNCVLSYAESMANGEAIILFVRQKNKPGKSYITLELQNKRIVQAKRCANKPVNYEDKSYLQELAKANGWSF